MPKIENNIRSLKVIRKDLKKVNEEIKGLEVKRDKLLERLGLRWFSPGSMDTDLAKSWKWKWLILYVGLCTILLVTIGLGAREVLSSNDTVHNIYTVNEDAKLYFQYIDEDGNGTPNLSNMSDAEKFALLRLTFKNNLSNADTSFNGTGSPTDRTCEGLFNPSTDGTRTGSYNQFIDRVRREDLRGHTHSAAVQAILSKRGLDEFEKELDKTVAEASEIAVCGNLSYLLATLKYEFFKNSNNETESKKLIVQKIDSVYQRIRDYDGKLLDYLGLSKNLSVELGLIRAILDPSSIANIKPKLISTPSRVGDMCSSYLEKGVFFADSIEGCSDDKYRPLLETVKSTFAIDQSLVFNNLSEQDKEKCVTAQSCSKRVMQITNNEKKIIVGALGLLGILLLVLGILGYLRFIKKSHTELNRIKKSLKTLNDSKGKIESEEKGVLKELEDLSEKLENNVRSKQKELAELNQRIMSVQPNDN